MNWTPNNFPHFTYLDKFIFLHPATATAGIRIDDCMHYWNGNPTWEHYGEWDFVKISTFRNEGRSFTMCHRFAHQRQHVTTNRIVEVHISALSWKLVLEISKFEFVNEPAGKHVTCNPHCFDWWVQNMIFAENEWLDPKQNDRDLFNVACDFVWSINLT